MANLPLPDDVRVLGSRSRETECVQRVTMTGQRFQLRKHQRLRSGRDFERVYAAKNAARQPGLLVFGLRNGLRHARFGVSVSRKHGGAVERNRLKRLLREAFRLEQHALPAGLDLVLIPQQGPPAALDQLRLSLAKAARSLDKRLCENEPNGKPE